MINYYGGQIVNELNEQCTHVFACEYDSQASQLETNETKKYKLVTPDWLLDSIEQNKLIDELPYNPKFLLSNPENKEIQVKQRTVTPEPTQTAATSAPQIVFKSQLILNELILADSEAKQSTPSPSSIKLVNNAKSDTINRILIHQQQHQPAELIDSSNDLSKHLSASSIQAQLENTIRLNNNKLNLDPTTNNTNSNQPILIQQLPVSVQTLVPIMPATTETTPPSKQKLKRSRKQSSGISPTGSTNNPNSQSNAAQSSTFTSEMDEIFNSVLSSVTNDETSHSNNTNHVRQDKTKEPHKEAIKPMYLSLIRHNSIQFDDDSSSQPEYQVQENSHLIQFDRCLLGCVFYIKASEVVYTAECLQDWKNVIDKYGGRTVDDYDQYANEITHVLVPNRFCSVYKRVI